jgi:hypothetical protein
MTTPHISGFPRCHESKHDKVSTIGNVLEIHWVCRQPRSLGLRLWLARLRNFCSSTLPEYHMTCDEIRRHERPAVPRCDETSVDRRSLFMHMPTSNVVFGYNLGMQDKFSDGGPNLSVCIQTRASVPVIAKIFRSGTRQCLPVRPHVLHHRRANVILTRLPSHGNSRGTRGTLCTVVSHCLAPLGYLPRVINLELPTSYLCR